LAVTELIALTGLRKSEALFLHVSDLDLESRLIQLIDRTDRRLKTEGSAGFAPMPKALIEPMRDWLSHRMDAPPGFERPDTPYLFPTIRTRTPWTSGSPTTKPLDRLQAVAKRAGVDGVTWHAFRRSFATHLEPCTTPAMIQRLCRHASPEITERYYRRADAVSMVAAVEDFRY
jgi:integrase